MPVLTSDEVYDLAKHPRMLDRLAVVLTRLAQAVVAQPPPEPQTADNPAYALWLKRDTTARVVLANPVAAAQRVALGLTVRLATALGAGMKETPSRFTDGELYAAAEAVFDNYLQRL